MGNEEAPPDSDVPASVPPADVVTVHIQTSGGGVHAVEMARKRVASLDALARGLAKGLPEGAAPTAAQLAEYRMRFQAGTDERQKLDAKDAAALRKAAEVASAIFAWPKKSA